MVKGVLATSEAPYSEPRAPEHTRVAAVRRSVSLSLGRSQRDTVSDSCQAAHLIILLASPSSIATHEIPMYSVDLHISVIQFV